MRPDILAMLLTWLVVTAANLFARPATQPATTRPAWPERHIVSGLVQDAGGGRVRGAIVFILDAETGIPYSNITDHPFTDMQIAGEPPLITHVATRGDGRFYIRGVFPGTYRLVAQSWNGLDPLTGWNKLPADITLHGIAENIRVPEDLESRPNILKPVGTATVRVTFDREDAIILISTKPPADVLLGPLAWQGDFLRNLIGATQLPKSPATFHGLPEGRLYLYAMGVDRIFAAGELSVVAKPGETVEAHIPVVSPWDGPRKLPDRLVPVAEAMKRDPRGTAATIEAAIGPDRKAGTDRGKWFTMPLGKQVVLPDGSAAMVRDVATVHAYENFNREARELAERRRGQNPNR